MLRKQLSLDSHLTQLPNVRRSSSEAGYINVGLNFTGGVLFWRLSDRQHSWRGRERERRECRQCLGGWSGELRSQRGGWGLEDILVQREWKDGASATGMCPLLLSPFSMRMSPATSRLCYQGSLGSLLPSWPKFARVHARSWGISTVGGSVALPIEF